MEKQQKPVIMGTKQKKNTVDNVCMSFRVHFWLQFSQDYHIDYKVVWNEYFLWYFPFKVR